MLILVLVGAGGAIGSVARYLISGLVQQRSHSGFPWGTVAVNLTGSLLIGIVFGAFDGRAGSGELLAFLVAGILGGYTTFSTFSVETMKLLENRRYLWALGNTMGQVTAGMSLALIGYWLGALL